MSSLSTKHGIDSSLEISNQNHSGLKPNHSSRLPYIHKANASSAEDFSNNIYSPTSSHKKNLVLNAHISNWESKNLLPMQNWRDLPSDPMNILKQHDRTLQEGGIKKNLKEKRDSGTWLPILKGTIKYPQPNSSLSNLGRHIFYPMDFSRHLSQELKLTKIPYARSSLMASPSVPHCGIHLSNNKQELHKKPSVGTDQSISSLTDRLNNSNRFEVNSVISRKNKGKDILQGTEDLPQSLSQVHQIVNNYLSTFDERGKRRKSDQSYNSGIIKPKLNMNNQINNPNFDFDMSPINNQITEENNQINLFTLESKNEEISLLESPRKINNELGKSSTIDIRIHAPEPEESLLIKNNKELIEEAGRIGEIIMSNYNHNESKFLDLSPIKETNSTYLAEKKTDQIYNAIRLSHKHLQDIYNSERILLPKIIYLNPIKDSRVIKKTLLLDLDETLIWTFDQSKIHQEIVNPSMSIRHKITYVERPYLMNFLTQMGSVYEIYLYTASSANYAKDIMTTIDPYRQYILGFLSREHCSTVKHKETGAVYIIKEVDTIVNRDKTQVVVLDNSIHFWPYDLGNLLPIKSFKGSKYDTELSLATQTLLQIAHAKDVTKYLRANYNLVNRVNEYSSNLNNL